MGHAATFFKRVADLSTIACDPPTPEIHSLH